MYGLPQDIKLEFFVGLNLNQICVGVGDIQLRFQKGVGLNIYGDLSIGKNGQSPKTFPCDPIMAFALTEMLNCSVVRAMASQKQPGTLCLEFSNGWSIAIHDSNEGYESCVIVDGDKEIAV
jgi:hypothetical protein